MLEHIEEYLVGIGADIDRQSFDTAMGALRQLEGGLRKLKYAAAPMAIAAFIAAVGKAAVNTIRDVAKTDMEYQKLAKDMWVTKESAKALKVAMDAMGVSQDDIAWIPELRQQFFRLREEINRFATPADADEQLRYIREIGYDVQALFVRLKMFKEWIAYHLIKYLAPYIKEFKAFLKYLSDMLGADMPEKARKIARVLSAVLSVAIQTVKAFGLVIKRVYDFIGGLPDNVKKWGAIFAAVGAAIMAGPFGMLLAGLSVAMLLIEDFMGYMNGWNSSSDLAPIWKALLEFADGTGTNWLDYFKNKLTDIADILDHFVNELHLEDVLRSIKTAVEELGIGLARLWKAQKKELDDLLKKFGIGLPQVKTFFGTIATGISEAIKTMAEFIKLVGRVLQAAALVKEGKFSEAAGVVKDSVIDFGKAVIAGNKNFFGKVKEALTGNHGGGGSGFDVVGNASQFEQGTQWMDPTGENTDPRNQCASFASQMMAGAGIDVEPTMNGDALAGQFKDEGAYHRAGEGYEPQPGDLIDWAHHVGIYAGNGEYIARNSSGGVVRGSMEGMEKYFGELWGFGSVSELQAAKNQGDSSQGAIPSIPKTENQDLKATASIVSGDQEMATSAIPGYGDIFRNTGQDILDGFKGIFNEFPVNQKELPVLSAENLQGSYAQMAYDNVSDGRPAYTPEQSGDVTNMSYGGLNIGDIHIHVSGSKATPQEIGKGVTDSIDRYWQTVRMQQSRGVVT